MKQRPGVVCRDRGRAARNESAPRLPARLRRAAAGLLAAAALAAGMAAPSRAGYVLYFHTFGDWSVICSLDEATRRRTCSLDAPPPALEVGVRRTQVTVAERGGGAFSVTIHVLGAVWPGQPAFLRVDGNAAHRTVPDRLGRAGWSGAEAAAIVDELKAGRWLVVRSFAPGSGAARDEFLSLAGFAGALKAYRDNRRIFGITDGT